MEGALEVSRGRFVSVGLIRVFVQDPIRQSFMQLSPQFLGQASVRSLAQECMREAPLPSRLVLQLNETASFERREGSLDLASAYPRGESGKSRDPEPATFDGRSFEEKPRRRIESVEPGRQQRLQRQGDLDVGVVRTNPAAIGEQSLIGEHCSELLQIQRVSLGRLADTVEDGCGGPLSEQEPGQ